MAHLGSAFAFVGHETQADDNRRTSSEMVVEVHRQSDVINHRVGQNVHGDHDGGQNVDQDSTTLGQLTATVKDIRDDERYTQGYQRF